MIILLLIMGFVFCSYFVNKTQPTINPIFMGDTQEKAVAFMFNVDWGEEILPDLLEVLKKRRLQQLFLFQVSLPKVSSISS